MDAFNPKIYPNEGFAKSMIDKIFELNTYMNDSEYLKLVEEVRSKKISIFLIY